MQCVITGCALIDPDTGRSVAGDLFDAGSVFVFNGNMGTDRQPEWLEGDPSYSKVITPSHYFERRAMFIIPREHIGLNEAALAYVTR